jgi:peptidoglycan/xylan/chitin deacetylase (PgdA/CDA1 family)
MRNASKKSLLWILDVFGINALCRLINRNKVLILWYHGVCDEGFKLSEKHIPKSAFRKQLEYLKRKGYTYVTMSEMLEAMENKKKLNKAVVLTFDDGFRNIVENAYPLMEEFDAKGCFYLVTGMVGEDRLLWTDQVENVVRKSVKDGKRNFRFAFQGDTIEYRLEDMDTVFVVAKDIKKKLKNIPDRERLEHLKHINTLKANDVSKEFTFASWEQINKLNPDILEIGSHCREHPSCTNLTSDLEFKEEICYAKRDIEENTGRKVEHFCYPSGSYDDRVIAKIIEYGHKSAVTIEYGMNDFNTDPYRLKRITASEEPLLFKASVSGCYGILKRIKAALTGR